MFNSYLIIFNPKAGKGFGEYYSNELKKELEKKGASTVRLFKSESEEDFYNFTLKLKASEDKPELVIIIGGDGTVGTVVNYFVKAGLYLPLASFGQGTCNDFTSEIKTKLSTKKFIKLLNHENLAKIDIINANERYAINVACGGAFTNGAVSYNNKLKRLFGKLAYYFKAIGCALKLKPQRLSINIDGIEHRENAYLFLIINSQRAGGIRNLSDTARINDGKLDIVVFKKCNFFKRLGIAFSILFKTLFKNKNVIIKQGVNFSVKPVHGAIKEFCESDLDGNVGPNYPVNVKVIKQKIDFIVSPKYTKKMDKIDKKLLKRSITKQKKEERKLKQNLKYTEKLKKIKNKRR